MWARLRMVAFRRKTSVAALAEVAMVEWLAREEGLGVALSTGAVTRSPVVGARERQVFERAREKSLRSAEAEPAEVSEKHWVADD